MTRSIAGAILYFLGSGSTYAQPAHPLTFEVASIKPAPPPDGRGIRVFANGGPGTSDPGRFTTENNSLSALVTQAFDIRSYQLSGPDWTGRALFNIVAKVPEGATKEQFRVMPQNLLIERFKLAYHRDKKEMPIYEMVRSKDGPKFKETVDDPAAAPPAPSGPPQLGKDGPGTSLGPGGAAVPQAGIPEGDTAPTIFTDIQQQLGLNLEPKKGMIDILVIDHLEKMPTEN